MKTFTPSDWYWVAEDGRVFSSSRQKLVKATDGAFKAWKEDGTLPARWPRDEAGQESDAELAAVLAPYGMALPGAVVVPQSVSRAQAKIALHRAGLLDMVKTAVAADAELQIWFDDAVTWDRQNEHVIQLGEQLLGDDPATIDALFVDAGKISV